ncbi:DNA adenine methylase [bacterium]|nr:DNA adenine methylase [bacterium]
MKNNKFIARPFLKWVGGKTQLLNELEKRLPDKTRNTGVIERYIEPFVGGGALFFYLQNKYKIKKAYLIDNNQDLILTYKVIKKDPEKLIRALTRLQENYLQKNPDGRRAYYYQIRDEYNKQMGGINYRQFSNSWIKRAGYLILLNKTCFNGLFRLNRKGEFNVPHGRYKNPGICDSDNIRNVSKVLAKTYIACADYSKCRDFAEVGALVYFDPPYRPINNTSCFTSYTKDGFYDREQISLAKLSKELSDNGAFVLLSNSDPTNENMGDNFFDKIYRGFNIKRVLASRMINCNGSKRGRIQELLIANY